jgi:uncharacterized LabA/DUF88 family protein
MFERASREMDTNKQTVYAFIDSQNLNLGVRSLGWKLDYKKFRLYLKNKFNVSSAFMFIGFVPDNQKLYTELQKAGFILVYKPTISHIINGKKIIKGNVDAELVLHAAAIEYENYDEAIIVTNDGDFMCLVQYLEEKNKLRMILAPNKRFSSLFKPFLAKLMTVDRLKDTLKK